jgi:hypothetical protein
MQTRIRNITLPQSLLAVTRQLAASDFQVIRRSVSVWGKRNSHDHLKYKQIQPQRMCFLPSQKSSRTKQKTKYSSHFCRIFVVTAERVDTSTVTRDTLSEWDRLVYLSCDLRSKSQLRKISTKMWKFLYRQILLLHSLYHFESFKVLCVLPVLICKV